MFIWLQFYTEMNPIMHDIVATEMSLLVLKR